MSLNLFGQCLYLYMYEVSIEIFSTESNSIVIIVKSLYINIYILGARVYIF